MAQQTDQRSHLAEFEDDIGASIGHFGMQMFEAGFKAGIAEGRTGGEFSHAAFLSAWKTVMRPDA